MGYEDLNTELRKALTQWGFRKTDKDRYEFSQPDRKFVWDSYRDGHFESCTKTYVATFGEHFSGERLYLAEDVDGKNVKRRELFEWCPWGWFSLDDRLYQVRCYLKNSGCKIE